MLGGHLRVLILSSSQEYRRWIRAAFTGEPLLESQIAECESIDAAIVRLRHHVFDVVLLDTSPIDVVEMAREARGAALFFIARPDCPISAREVLDAGATEYLSIQETGLDPGELWQAMRQGLRFHRIQRERAYFAEILREREEKVVHLAVQLSRQFDTDRRTGWPSTQRIEGRLDEEYQRATRYHLPLTVVLMELVGLESILDDHGGEVVDTIFTDVAERIRQVARRTDVPGHHGNDCFLILLTNTDREGGLIFCHRVTAAMSRPIEVHDLRVELRCWFGLAEYRPDVEEAPRNLLDLAQERLEKAKQRGIAGALVFD